MHVDSIGSPLALRTFGAVLAGVCLALAGCDEFKPPKALNDAAQNVQQNVNQAVDAAKQQIAPSSGVELSLSPPVTNGQCYAELIAPADGRPGVLILATYRDAATENFPSVYAQVKTNVQDARQLIGQTVPADLFVRRVAGGPVLRSTPEDPVQLRILSADGTQVTAEVVKGSVVSVDTNEATPFLGKLTARLQ